MLKIKEVRENWILTKLITRIVITMNEIRTKLAYDPYSNSAKSKRRDSRFRGFDSIRFLERRFHTGGQGHRYRYDVNHELSISIIETICRPVVSYYDSRSLFQRCITLSATLKLPRYYS